MSSRLLPEWAPQCGVMLAWPAPHTDWVDILDDAEASYVEIASAIALRETCVILCVDETHREHILGRLRPRAVNEANLRFVHAPYNDTWIRDYGPISVAEGLQLLLRDFGFNGWGRKFEAGRDNAVNRNLAAQGLFRPALESIPLFLEGGALETDGKGTLLTTSACLLSPMRNPHLDRRDTEKKLQQTLGIDRVLWLEHGHLAGDDTDSHIDTLARFCDEHTICYVACDDREDEHYDDLAAMAEELQDLRDRDGNPYKLVPLPWPAGKYAPDGHRLPASYANFLIINDAVLVPTYRDNADPDVLSILTRCFPDRQVIGIDCLPLIQQHGSLHCVTMQLPKGVL
ncbi:MAG: agmatine/peptidylarginine deiminase [Gammaproteobacteria bacterium]